MKHQATKKYYQAAVQQSWRNKPKSGLSTFGAELTNNFPGKHGKVPIIWSSAPLYKLMDMCQNKEMKEIIDNKVRSHNRLNWTKINITISNELKWRRRLRSCWTGQKARLAWRWVLSYVGEEPWGISSPPSGRGSIVRDVVLAWTRPRCYLWFPAWASPTDMAVALVLASQSLVERPARRKGPKICILRPIIFYEIL